MLHSRVGSSPNHKARLERLGREKHTRLLSILVNYRGKCFITGVNPIIKKIMFLFTPSFCKLGHFSIIGKVVYTIQMV
jgi:hypothetical protein